MHITFVDEKMLEAGDNGVWVGLNHIAVLYNSADAVDSILSHEMYHVLEEYDTKAARSIKNKVLALLSTKQKTELRNKYAKQYGYEANAWKNNKDVLLLVDSEITADSLFDAFHDTEFIRSLTKDEGHKISKGLLAVAAKLRAQAKEYSGKKELRNILLKKVKELTEINRQFVDSLEKVKSVPEARNKKQRNIAKKSKEIIDLYEQIKGTTPATSEEAKDMDMADIRNVARFASAVDDVLHNRLPSNMLVLVGKPSNILAKYMKSENLVYVSQNVIKKIVLPQIEAYGKHGLGVGAMCELLYQLSDPMMITGNTVNHIKANDNSIVVWTEWLSKNGDSIVSPIRIDIDSHNGKYNNVNTLFDLFDKDYEGDLLRADNILYTKENKDVSELIAQRREVPKWEPITSSKDSILQNNEKVNTKNKKSSKSAIDTEYDRLVEKYEQHPTGVLKNKLDKFVLRKAKQSGYNIEAYVGTPIGGYTVFDSKFSDDKLSLFAAQDKRIAESYTRIDDTFSDKPIDLNSGDLKQQGIYHVAIKMNNPYVIDAKGRNWDDLSEHKPHSILSFGIKAKKVGIDVEFELTYHVYQKGKSVDSGTGTYSNGTEVMNALPENVSKQLRKSIGDDLDRKVKDYRENMTITGRTSIIVNGGHINLDKEGNRIQKMTTRAWSKYAKEHGYDGVVIKNVYDMGSSKVKPVKGTIYIAYDGEQFKSLDTVTYDDSGNIIPLSERFNADNRDIRHSKENIDYSDYDKPITLSDISTLRSIGEKSINDFTSEDIKKSQKWAYKFYKQLGTRSPFFRAWFGDWRAYDKTPVNYTITVGSVYSDVKQVVNDIKNDIKSNNLFRGDVENIDTKFKINIGSHFYNDTLTYALRKYSRDNDIVAFSKVVNTMSNIETICKNAILLNTEISKNKNQYSSFIHRFYLLNEIGDKEYLIKLSIEELNSNDDVRRAYNLKEIEISSNAVSGSFNYPDTLKDISKFSVADLYSLVKTYDKDFHSGKAVNPALLNKDGTPKVFYHGTNAEFDVFDISRANNGSLGKGFYFSGSKEYAKGHTISNGKYTGRVIEAFLNIKNPYSVSYPGNIDTEKLKAKGYDSVYHPGNDFIVVFDSDNIKSVDNIGTFDGSSRNIKHSKSVIDDTPTVSAESTAKAKSVIEDMKAQALKANGKDFDTALYDRAIATLDEQEKALRGLEETQRRIKAKNTKVEMPQLTYGRAPKKIILAKKSEVCYNELTLWRV